MSSHGVAIWSAPSACWTRTAGCGSPRAPSSTTCSAARSTRSLFRLDPESRAGLDFIRARRLEQLGQDSHLLYASVRKRDLLSGWVHRLIGAWAAPERKNDVLVFARGE